MSVWPADCNETISSQPLVADGQVWSKSWPATLESILEYQNRMSAR